MLNDTMHAELSASSDYEVQRITMEFECEPLRWQTPPDQWPDPPPPRPDDYFCVVHELQDPTDLWAIDWGHPDPFPQGRGRFGRRIEKLLPILHRVWIQDFDPRALRVANHEWSCRERMDHDDLQPHHVEDIGTSAIVFSHRQLRDYVLQKDGYLTHGELEQYAAVWEKVTAMIIEVTTHLATQGGLTEAERQAEPFARSWQDHFALAANLIRPSDRYGQGARHVLVATNADAWPSPNTPPAQGLWSVAPEPACDEHE